MPLLAGDPQCGYNDACQQLRSKLAAITALPGPEGRGERAFKPCVLNVVSLSKRGVFRMSLSTAMDTGLAAVAIDVVMASSTVSVSGSFAGRAATAAASVLPNSSCQAKMTSSFVGK